MTPTIRSNAKKPTVRVQPKIATKSVPVNLEDQRRQFREARLAREKERFEKLRDSRVKSSSSTASAISSSISITSNVSCPSTIRHQLPAAKKVNSRNVIKMIGPSTAPSSTSAAAQQKQGVAIQQLSKKNMTQVRLVSKPRRSTTSGRRSIMKLRVDKTAKSRPLTRKTSKVEVKLNRTTQLRLIKADPLFDMSKLSTDKHKHIILPVPERFVPKHRMQSESSKKASCEGEADGNSRSLSKAQRSVGSPQLARLSPLAALSSTSDISDSEVEEIEHPQSRFKKTSFLSSLPKASIEKSSKFQSPSRIPVKRASFVSPMAKTSASTPKPSPLRERLAEWLEKRQHSLENFKHLKCFGVLGPAVKRPQTPFRKVLPSTSILKVIPESTETTPIKELHEDSCLEDDKGLNTTFTLEEEDKENICDLKEHVTDTLTENLDISNADNVKELDQSRGVLSELHKLIQMGYPTEQCNLWLRAVRRRFPQCGDEAVYWECLAALEESRGDLESAVSCYQRAILQGAEDAVQKSLEELQKRISELNIEASPKRVFRQHENSLLDSSNIMKSSAIQFEVQEKCNLSVRKNDTANESYEVMFTATPVRRSTRLATTPKHNTPGITCVRSLEYLEPKVRKSLVFHGNKALEPRD